MPRIIIWSTQRIGRFLDTATRGILYDQFWPLFRFPDVYFEHERALLVSSHKCANGVAPGKVEGWVTTREYLQRAGSTAWHTPHLPETQTTTSNTLRNIITLLSTINNTDIQKQRSEGKRLLLHRQTTSRGDLIRTAHWNCKNSRLYLERESEIIAWWRKLESASWLGGQKLASIRHLPPRETNPVTRGSDPPFLSPTALSSHLSRPPGVGALSPTIQGYGESQPRPIGNYKLTKK